MDNFRMPRPHPGRYPAYSHPGQALARPFGMNLANPIYTHNSFSRSDRSYWQNPYESGNENRRRNVRRVRAEQKERRYPQPHVHAGFPGLGAHRLGGLRPAMHPGGHNQFPMMNPYLGGMGPRQLGNRLPRWPYRPGFGVRFPTHANPYGFRHRGNANARRYPLPFSPRGYPPRPIPRRPSYSTSLFEDEDGDDEFDISSTTNHWLGRRDRLDDMGLDDDDDDDDDDDLFSTSTHRPFHRYDAGPNRRYHTEWDDDEDDEDDDYGDDVGMGLRFGMEACYGHSRPYRNNNYFSY